LKKTVQRIILLPQFKYKKLNKVLSLNRKILLVLGKKDFLMRIRISRKEAKESCYWLKLLSTSGDNENLLKEATELMKIFGAILEKSK